MEDFAKRIFMILSSSRFLGSDNNSGLSGNRFVGLVNRVLAAESFIAGAIQFCRTADGVEKVLQVRLMRRFIEKDRDFVLRQLRGFAHIHFRGVLCGSGLGADVALLKP